jgi:heptosyltransferase-2
MEKILLIKIGALGDVLRTTCLLRILEGEVTWVTQRNAFPLLKNNPFVRRVADIASSRAALGRDRYDLVINLDEEPRACALASGLKSDRLIGAYGEGKKIAYTESSAEWFDMGLISRLGKKTADRRKWENRKSYQEIIFGMLGKKFRGEEYVLAAPGLESKKDGTPPATGIETRSGDRWAGKRWSRFPEFLALLKKNKIPHTKFRTYPSLEKFIRRIAGTDPVVTTDSLALHIALALGKKVVALFTCTSFHEIYDYGRMAKIVSPLIEKYFYSTDPRLKSGEAIDPRTVFGELMKLKDKKIPPPKAGSFPTCQTWQPASNLGTPHLIRNCAPELSGVSPD